MRTAAFAALLALTPPALCAGPLHVDWSGPLAVPAAYVFGRKVEHVKTWKFADFDVEFYRQANGPGTAQRVFVAVPKAGHAGRRPAVVVPFYFPECMLGFDPETGERMPKYEKIAMMADLAKRGFVTISADAYHLTYLKSALQRQDFSRWRISGAALHRDWPEWSGVGKLVADTRLLVDMLVADARVDAERIGIIGHSLGGKMAFYTGCLDSRIKAIVTSDWGYIWDSTNWRDIWYWGARETALKKSGRTHDELLEYAGGKPFMLIAGMYDGAEACAAIRRVKAYEGHQERLELINHASGHRPPPGALEAGYRFLERHLGVKPPSAQSGIINGQ